MHGYGIAALASLLGAGAVLCALAFRRFPGGSPRRREAAANLLLLFFVSAFLSLAIETFFYLFVIQSDGFEFTLAAQRWNALYGGPTNTQGFRDIDHPPESLQGKRVLVALGDSFTKGNGIRDYRNRFSNRLADRLGKDWTVVTMAHGGWDTTDELKALKACPYKPDIVVLQYFLNDIKHAALAKGLEMVPTPPSPPRWLKPLVDYSYAVNYIYWRAFRIVQSTNSNFWKNIGRYYADDALWGAHRAALQELVEYAHTRDIRVVAIVFPNMSDVDGSKSLTARVAAAFDALNVPTIDLAPTFSGRPVRSMICNDLDTHPNEAVHAETAKIIFDKLTALGWLAPR